MGDGLLLGEVGVQTSFHVELGRLSQAHGAAVDATEESFRIQELEVLADAVLGHAESLDEVSDCRAPVGVYGLYDLVSALLGKHDTPLVR